MDPGTLYPTCVLKVNLGCCKACVVNLKKLLLKIDGVYAVDIDAQKGLVAVSGKADPATLVEKIAKKKKKAEILSYEEPPCINGQNKDSENMQTGRGKCCGDGDDDDEKTNGHDSSDHVFEDYKPPKVFEDIECRDPHCRLHHKKSIIRRNNNNYVPMVKLQPPPNGLPYPPLPPPLNPLYPHYYWEYLPRPLPQYDPCCFPRRPPPQHYVYYGAQAYAGK